MSDNTIPAALIAGFICIVLLLALRPMAISHKLVDKPGGRKRHVGHVPIIGGICMFSAFLIGAMLAIPAVNTLFLVFGSSLLVFVGVLDDRYDLPASVRFGAQFSSVLLMVFGGAITVETIGAPFFGGEIQVGSFSLLLTVVLSIALINAINMTDGVDGLAGGLALLALSGLFVAGYGTDVSSLALIGVAVVASFLAFNFPLKLNRTIRTFMGDAGSTFLGFLIAWLCIMISQPPAATLSPVAVLGLVAMPLYDLTSCFFRRIIAGNSPFTADRNHFHHVLLEAGLKRRQVLAVLLTLGVFVASTCLAMFSIGASDGAILLAWATFGVCIDFGLRRYRASHDRRTVPRL
ncbi:MAG: MraY family glycosyltransferase [Pseudomonadota bacterium]